MRNEDGVRKEHAMANFDDTMGLAVRHKKLTQERKSELVDKIQRVVSNDAAAFAGTETDIKVSVNSENGEIMIDMVAHYMRADKDRPDFMDVSYAAANCVIANATLHQMVKVKNLVREIISTTLKGMDMPGGDAERAQVERSLEGEGKWQILEQLTN